MVLDTVCGGEGSLLGSQICSMAVQTKGWVGAYGFTTLDIFMMIDKKCTVVIRSFLLSFKSLYHGTVEFGSRHSCVSHSNRSVSLNQCVIEWFHTVEDFGSFSVFYSCSTMRNFLGSIMGHSFRDMFPCVSSHSRVHLQAPVVFVRMDFDGLLFLVEYSRHSVSGMDGCPLFIHSGSTIWRNSRP